MNKSLYYSSAIVGAIILFISLGFYNSQLSFLYSITYIGIMTSILNHCTTSYAIKYTDRFVLVLSFLVYIYYAFFISSNVIKISIFVLLGISVLCYLLCKLIISLSYTDLFELPVNQISNTLHMTSHFLVLSIFILIHYGYDKGIIGEPSNQISNMYKKIQSTISPYMNIPFVTFS